MKNKRYQEQAQNRQPKKKYKQKSCPSQFLCESLQVLNKCKLTHAEKDFELAKYYDRLKKLKRFVVIFSQQNGEAQKGQIKAISLLCQQLPIQIVGENKQKVQQIKNDKPNSPNQSQHKVVTSVYFEAQFIGPNTEMKRVKAKIVKQIARFGELEHEIQIGRTLRQPYYLFPKASQNVRLQIGVIKMNWQRLKVLKNNSATEKPIYLDDQRQYPFRQGCIVSYTTRKVQNRVKIQKVYSIKYDKFRFTGVLKIDESGLFYIKCRNWRHQNIDIASVPQALKRQIKQIQSCFPFSILKPKKKLKSQVQLINSALAKFLLKGEFYDWPHHFQQPIGVVQEQFSLLSLKSLKEAVIYEYRINQARTSEKQKKQSQKLLSDLQKRKDLQKQDLEAFTIDSLGTSCHDDAISVRRNNQGDKRFEIGIHIADVDQYVPYNSSLNDEIKRKDKTMYIRGFYSPMFSIPLLKYFSLSQGKNKLAYSLYFTLTQNGLIDFRSVEFRQSCVKIINNYFHGKNLRQVEKLGHFFDMYQCIKQSNMLKENNLSLNEQSQTEGAIESLMLISSMVATFMWKINYERIKNLKKQVDSYINKMVDELKACIKQWEHKLKAIKQTQKKLQLVNSQIKKIKSKIQKQADLEIKKLKQADRQVKKNQKQKSKMQKKQKKVKDVGEGVSEDEQQQQEQQQQEIDAVSLTEASISQKASAQIQLKQLKEEQQRQKKLKKTLQKQIKVGQQIQQDQSQSSDQSEIETTKEDYQRKRNQAKRALNGYLTKIFQILQVDIKWSSRQQIRVKFQQAKRFDTSQIFKQFIKRVYIMNHQHFKYIIQIMKQKNRQNGRQNRQVLKPQVKYKMKAQTQTKEIQNKKGWAKIEDFEQEKKNQKISQQNQAEQKKQHKQYDQTKFKQVALVKQANNGLEKVEVVLVKPFEQDKNQLKKKDLRVEGLSVGKKWTKKNNYSHLLFKIFSQPEEFLVTEKFVKFDPPQKQEYLSTQLQKQFLKFVIIGIQSRQELKLPQKQRKDLTKICKQLAQQSYRNYLKQQSTPFEQFLDRQIQICKQKVEAKNASTKAILQNAKFIRELRKMPEINSQKKSQQKKQVIKKDPQNAQNQVQADENFQKLQQQATQGNSVQNTEKNVQNRQKSNIKPTKKQIKEYAQIYLTNYKKQLIQRLQERHNLSDSKIQQETQNCLQQDYIQEVKIKTQHQSKITNQILEKIDQKKFLSFKIQDFYNESTQIDRLIKQQIIFLYSQIKEIPIKIILRVKQYIKQKVFFQSLRKEAVQFLLKQAQKNSKKLVKQQKTFKKQKIEAHDQDQSLNIQQYNQKIIQKKCKKMAQFLSKINAIFYNDSQIFLYFQKLEKQLFAKYFLQQKQFNFKKRASQINEQNQKQRIKKGKAKPSQQKQSSEKAVSQNIFKNQKYQPKDQKPNERQQLEKQALPIHEQKQKQKQKNIKNEIKPQNNCNIQAQISQKNQVQKQKAKNKTTKKQLKKLWDDKKKQIIQKLKQKYGQNFIQKEKQAEELKKQAQSGSSELKDGLQKIQSDYNIIDYMLEKMKKQQKKNTKKSRKQKKQEKSNDKMNKIEEDDNQNCEYIENVFLLIDQYRKKSGYKFKIWKVQEIEKYLAQKLKLDDDLDLQNLNKQFSQLSRDEQQLLKWNNPIRSYDALQTMRIIKDCEWVFNGKISPLDILIDYKAIKLVKSRIASLEKSKLQKKESEQCDKKHKEANRQIQKIQFYYKVKNRPEQQYQFLNVTSPNESAKFVFHPTLGEIQVFNSNFKQQIFRPVRGKIKIISQFPIQIKAVLLEKNKK